ncbi:polyphosphate kinase 2 family protein [candidate division KSB1 bacterium]|nr:polyphosphate kinase 2 family protein [candidate division KSB1 bacterium]
MDKYQVKNKIKLDSWDPQEHGAFGGSKKDALDELINLNTEFAAVQEKLYAENKHKLLIVLQGMDAGGKDGTIRKVFAVANPQGVRVAGFKVPSEKELTHDYLWRVHHQVPAKGEIVIFNRSHYEDVLVVRVHNLVPEKVWKKRYRHINEFERLLADEGTTILKFFLLISNEEQKQRLQARADNPEKRWKFNPGDLDERKLWNKYMSAYEEMLNRTSTNWAPWYIIPADKKWYRNWLIATIVMSKLRKLKIKIPIPDLDWDKFVVE